VRQARARTRRARLALAAVLAPVAAGAADIAVLKSSDVAGWRPTIDALRASASGHTITEYDLRGDRSEADRVLAGLKGKSVVLVAMGPLAAQAAREAAPELPLVYCMIPEPARLSLTDLNTAGVAFSIPLKNQFAAFRMVNPRAVRIGVIHTVENVGRQVQEAAKSVGVLRLALVEKAIGSEREVPEALRGLLRGDEAVDALWFPPDPVLLGDDTRRTILRETARVNRPVYAFSSSLVEEGALVSNGPNYRSIGDLVAELVNRLLAGERRIEMLIPQASLVVNKKAADKLGVEIPTGALDEARRSGRVIE
jgi:putative ABC transport system substrate-binding protein